MTLQSSREIAADPASVFAAFENSERLARWWGPKGFTNTFETCQFIPGGCWRFIMQGPNGKRYPNESVIQGIEHIVVPANEQNLERLAAVVASS